MVGVVINGHMDYYSTSTHSIRIQVLGEQNIEHSRVGVEVVALGKKCRRFCLLFKHMC